MTAEPGSPNSGTPRQANHADTAGVPWAGRHFETNTSADDDGSAPELLETALGRFRGGETDQAEVIDALRECRLLIPLVARLGDSEGRGDVTVDKSQELSIVTVAAPDGRSVQPAFSSVEAMKEWDPQARPVPVSAVRVALAAAAEGTELVVIDPGGAGEFVVRRPALWALAQAQPWLPCYRDPEVLAAVESTIEFERAVSGVSLEAGDPRARLEGAELVVNLELQPGLAQRNLDALMGRLAAAWSVDPVVALRVDSLVVRLTTRA